ncbi:MAG: hypothetical protein ABSD20_10375 [Terriglobales bacterium]|jgi:hypothetical protein
MKSRNQFAFHLFLTILACLMAVPLLADTQGKGQGTLDPAEPKGITPQQIIDRFAAKEKQFKLAREQYTYHQSIKVQTLDGDTVTGEFRLEEDILFDDKGHRLQQVVFAPQSTLENGGISMSREDIDDFEHRLPFVLTSDEIGEYSILYVGQQQEDELQTYVFDIAPKQIEKNKRYFQGRIWVDNQDFQIVKTEGKTVPDIRKKSSENLFPKFTTYRQQVDGQYWFPAYTSADDILHFKTGAVQDVHIREILKYTNYKRFGSSVKITYEGQEVQKAAPQGDQQPPKK